MLAGTPMLDVNNPVSHLYMSPVPVSNHKMSRSSLYPAISNLISLLVLSIFSTLVRSVELREIISRYTDTVIFVRIMFSPNDTGKSAFSAHNLHATSIPLSRINKSVRDHLAVSFFGLTSSTLPLIDNLVPAGFKKTFGKHLYDKTSDSYKWAAGRTHTRAAKTPDA